MIKELLLDMCEYIADNVSDYELEVTNDFEGRGHNTDPRGKGISIGIWECETKKERRHCIALLNKFIRAWRSYGMVCSDVIDDPEEATPRVDIEYNAHIDRNVPFEFIGETANYLTIKFGNNKVNLKKVGKFDGADRYTAIDGVLVWNKNFRLEDGRAVSTTKGFVTDEYEENPTINHKLCKSTFVVDFPKLKEAMFDIDILADALCYAGDTDFSFHVSPDIFCFYEELFDYMKEHRNHWQTICFEGYFFSDSEHAKWNVK